MVTLRTAGGVRSWVQIGRCTVDTTRQLPLKLARVYQGMNNRFKRVMLRQVGKVWYDKKQSKTKTVFGENALLRWERKSVFVEKHIFRGYIVSIEDVSRANTTEEVIRNIQWELNSREEFCQKQFLFWVSFYRTKLSPPVAT